MHRLGYTRYVAQGGDVGALVTDLMGRQAVEGLVGYHLNLLTAVLAIGDHLPKERAAAEAFATFREDGFGYFLEMATRPQHDGGLRRRRAHGCVRALSRGRRMAAAGDGGDPSARSA